MTYDIALFYVTEPEAETLGNRVKWYCETFRWSSQTGGIIFYCLFWRAVVLTLIDH